jgi:RNA polymerase sigma-70 factor (ECF subfamily)
MRDAMLKDARDARLRGPLYPERPETGRFDGGGILVSYDLALPLEKNDWRLLSRREESRVSMSQGDDPDVALLRRCQAGDESAYVELLARYQERAYWIAYNMIHDAEEARDLAQEAFVRVFRSVQAYDPRRKFYTWLYRIVLNLAIDHLRKRSTVPATTVESAVLSARFEGGALPERSLEERELGSRIESVLAQLPSKYRAVILLRDIDGLSCKEIARIVGSTHATVRWRLHKARQLFREQWEKRFARERS